MRTLKLAVTPAVDIWSLGCVFSECATWISRGRNRVSEYQRQRRKELHQIHGRDLGDLFHDGQKPLKAVADSHNSVKKICGREDFVTPKVIDEIIAHMLLEEKDYRSNAHQLHGASIRVTNTAQAELDEYRGAKNKRKESITSNQPHPPDSDVGSVISPEPNVTPNEPQVPQRLPLRQETSVEQPRISVAEVLSQRQKYKSLGIQSKLPRHDLLEDLKNRDHVSCAQSAAFS